MAKPRISWSRKIVLISASCVSNEINRSSHTMLGKALKKSTKCSVHWVPTVVLLYVVFSSLRLSRQLWFPKCLLWVPLRTFWSDIMNFWKKRLVNVEFTLTINSLSNKYFYLLSSFRRKELDIKHAVHFWCADHKMCSQLSIDRPVHCV